MTKAPQGVEYIVDAYGCDAERLQSLPGLQGLFAEIIGRLALSPVDDPMWHVFPGAGGITGVVLLAESHFTIHTYPEAELATINLYHCRGSAEWAWEAHLRDRLGARTVTVRMLRRGHANSH